MTVHVVRGIVAIVSVHSAGRQALLEVCCHILFCSLAAFHLDRFATSKAAFAQGQQLLPDFGFEDWCEACDKKLAGEKRFRLAEEQSQARVAGTVLVLANCELVGFPLKTCVMNTPSSLKRMLPADCRGTRLSALAHTRSRRHCFCQVLHHHGDQTPVSEAFARADQPR